jgi:hypothetical protein
MLGFAPLAAFPLAIVAPIIAPPQDIVPVFREGGDRVYVAISRVVYPEMEDQ